MSDWDFLNGHRVGNNDTGRGINPMFWTTPEAGFNGMFRFWDSGQCIRIIASDGEGWQHVSVSIEKSDRPPYWSTMCKVKDLFWEDEDVVCQFHPRKSEYVNHHPGCLHLWRCTTQEFPTPDPIMVGPRK